MQFGIHFLFFLLSAFGAVAEDACLPTEVVKFAELYANPHLHPCQKVSAGFSLAPPMGYPTDPQVKAMCASDACLALIKDVLDLKPADCFLSFAGVKLNVYKMACSFEDGCKSDHEEDKYHPTSQPTNETEYHPTPKPPKKNEYHPTPKPTKYEDHPTPKPTKEEYHPTPKPTKHYPTSKPTDDKYYTPKPTDNDSHYEPEEPMVIKCDHGKAYPKHWAEKETAKDAEVKPPMNSTAFELFPMPNTTYKATALPKA